MFIQINTLPFAEKIFEIIVCKKNFYKYEQKYTRVHYPHEWNSQPKAAT